MSGSIARVRGFTLVELLVVLSILTILMGMLMPLMGIAKRSSMRSVTQAIMGKTEAALYQFKADYHGYPYQLTYADEGQPWTNALNYSLGTDIAAPDQAAVKADMNAAAAAYGYSLNGGSPQPAQPHAFTDNRHNGASAQDQGNQPEGDPAPWYPAYNGNNHTWYWVYSGGMISTCVMLNRLGAERASTAMLVGDVEVCGVKMLPMSGPGGLSHNGRDLSAIKLVPNAQSASSPPNHRYPGWAKDYLQGQIDAKYLRDATILDAYFHPLIYICQVVPGCDTAFGQILNSPVDINNTDVYGLQPLGRRTLRPFNPGTNTPITGDAATLPDPNNLMHSDMRFWAAPGYELEFELWSAGPDGRMSWWRDDAANRDNVSCAPYNKGIGTTP